MMEPLGLFSGEGAWGGNLLSFPTVQSLFAYSLSSRYRSLVTLLSILALLLIFYLLSSQLRFVRNMANGPITNGRADDASKDFKGNLKVNDKPPTKDLLEKVADLPVLDMNKKSHTFKSLYADNENGPRRVLIVFIRHFFCGNCQEYIHVLASSITPSALAGLSPPTSIVIIGCGSADLIPMYMKETACPFPIYADPTRKLYDMLGMTKTLSLGPSTPEYLQRSLLSMAFSSFVQELKSGRKMLSGGDFRQVGGEFVFSGGKVTFCKRMRNTRDHAEVSEIRKQLGLDRTENNAIDKSEIPPAKKRWSTSGLGSGLGRRLSSRRRSWAPMRSGSRKADVKGSPERKAMAELKEEEGDQNASATPEDALARLEGKPLQKQEATDDTAKNASANDMGAVTGQEVETKKENAIAVDEPIEVTMNGSANGHVTA